MNEYTKVMPLSGKIALLVKSFGFNAFSKSYYKLPHCTCIYESGVNVSNDEDNIVVAPTYEMVTTWLREKWGIYIWVEPEDSLTFRIGSSLPNFKAVTNSVDEHIEAYADTFQAAQEKAIIMATDIIQKRVKNKKE